MKILVPTDLSPVSKVAVLYAAKLSVALKAKLILVNVFFVDVLTKARTDIVSEDFTREKRKQREQECIHLVEEIKAKVHGDLQIQYAIESEGPLGETISENAQQRGCD